MAKETSPNSQPDDVDLAAAQAYKPAELAFGAVAASTALGLISKGLGPFLGSLTQIIQGPLGAVFGSFDGAQYSPTDTGAADVGDADSSDHEDAVDAEDGESSEASGGGGGGSATAGDAAPSAPVTPDLGPIVATLGGAAIAASFLEQVATPVDEATKTVAELKAKVAGEYTYGDLYKLESALHVIAKADELLGPPHRLRPLGEDDLEALGGGLLPVTLFTYRDILWSGKRPKLAGTEVDLFIVQGAQGPAHAVLAEAMLGIDPAAVVPTVDDVTCTEKTIPVAFSSIVDTKGMSWVRGVGAGDLVIDAPSAKPKVPAPEHFRLLLDGLDHPHRRRLPDRAGGLDWVLDLTNQTDSAGIRDRGVAAQATLAENIPKARAHSLEIRDDQVPFTSATEALSNMVQLDPFVGTASFEFERCGAAALVAGMVLGGRASFDQGVSHLDARAKSVRAVYAELVARAKKAASRDGVDDSAGPARLRPMPGLSKRAVLTTPWLADLDGKEVSREVAAAIALRSRYDAQKYPPIILETLTARVALARLTPQTDLWEPSRGDQVRCAAAAIVNTLLVDASDAINVEALRGTAEVLGAPIGGASGALSSLENSELSPLHVEQLRELVHTCLEKAKGVEPEYGVTSAGVDVVLDELGRNGAFKNTLLLELAAIPYAPIEGVEPGDRSQAYKDTGALYDERRDVEDLSLADTEMLYGEALAALNRGDNTGSRSRLGHEVERLRVTWNAMCRAGCKAFTAHWSARIRLIDSGAALWLDTWPDHFGFARIYALDEKLWRRLRSLDLVAVGKTSFVPFPTLVAAAGRR